MRDNIDTLMYLARDHLWAIAGTIAVLFAAGFLAAAISATNRYEPGHAERQMLDAALARASAVRP